MFDRSPILARGYSRAKKVMTGSATALPTMLGVGQMRPGFGRGVGQGGVGQGGGCCDQQWVEATIARALQCKSPSANVTPDGRVNLCGATADMLSLPASASIAAGDDGAVELTRINRANFMGRRLVVPASIAASFEITDVLIDEVSIFTPNRPVSAELFSSDNQMPMFLNFRPMTSNSTVRVEFSNIIATAAIFRVAIEGASW